VQVCESREDALDGAARFARRYNMTQEHIARPAEQLSPSIHRAFQCARTSWWSTSMKGATVSALLRLAGTQRI
jgi:hypothetical protein